MTGARTGITERELAALRFVGEQYAVPMAVLAELLERDPGVTAASAPRLARRVAERLERLGYADRRPLLGQQWVIPTRTGLRAAGLSYPATVPAPILLKHTATVARLRLHLETAEPTAVWECERSIRDHWRGTKVRRADGALWWDDGGGVGVECELFVKKAARYQAILHDVDPGWDQGVWWFCPPQHVATLAARLREAGGGDFHMVHALPEGVAW